MGDWIRARCANFPLPHLIILPLLIIPILPLHHSVVTAAALTPRASPKPLPGGCSAVSPSSYDVIEIGKFSVEEYNKQAKENLKFRKVVSGCSQVVAGTNYKLLVEAADDGHVRRYNAVVWIKAWENFRNLTSFAMVV